MPLVLVVEDNEDVREILVETVQAFGYEVTVAETAADAVVSVSYRQPDAILLDIVLPDAEGTAGLERLKRLRPDVPIIMVTANSDDDLARETLKRGAFDYVMKPFDRGHLARALEAAVAR
jgi:two-component system nitrogen regulation response regulator GlnG